MANTKLPYTHLLYVRQYSIITNDYELFVVGVNTKDIFHTIGEYYFRSEVQVIRIDYVECTQQRLDYWAKEGYEIHTFRNKYDDRGTSYFNLKMNVASSDNANNFCI